MAKLNKEESRVLKEILTVAIENKEIAREDRETLDDVYIKIDSFTLKTIEELSQNQLRELVYRLMQDIAGVLGEEVEECCLKNYGLEW